MLAVFSPVDQA
jgi:hypothetical protein